MEINKIICGDTLAELKKLPAESIDCIITSPPYYGLRDYGTAKWEGGDEKCDHQVENKIREYQGDWDRPSRKEFNKIGTLLKCQVCGKEFYGKLGQKFCSTKCLNTLSNEERANALSELSKTCYKCGAKRIDQQLGLEKTLDEYLEKMLLITAELKRVLKKTGTMWWNHGDSYGGSGKGRGSKTPGKNLPYKECHPERTEGIEKSLMLQNFRLAQEMIDQQQWILRNIIIWHKPNCMPSSVKDRFTVDFEPIFFFSKSKKYWFEPQYEKYTEPMDRWGGDELKANGKSTWDEGTGQDTYRDRNMRPNEMGRNKRAVWKIPTQPFKEAHFATFPEKLIEPMILAGSPKEVCKKCGKARETIFDISYKESEGKWGKQTRPKQEKTQDKKEGYRPTENLTKIAKPIGHTDCGCNAGWDKGIVLDPFMGSGTSGMVAKKLGRNYLGIELNPKYVKMAEERLRGTPTPLF